jgi:ABC-2 type transport system ATP-binding protein
VNEVEARPVVLAEGLGKDYREGFLMRTVSALDQVSFSVAPGLIHGLLGPNGAGKSTTLHLLLGFIRPTRGRAIVFGRPPSDSSSRRRLGFLPEVFAFDGFTTGRRLLRRFDVLAEHPVDGREARVDAAIEAVNLADAAPRAIGTYSKGMMQRIGLAQALLGDPDLVILDEPMSGMDPATRYSVRKILKARKDRGKTTVLSSHILSDVEALADRVLILDRGRVVADGSPDSLAPSREGCAIVFHDPRPERFDLFLAEHGLARGPAGRDSTDQRIEKVNDAVKQRVLAHLTAEKAEIVSVTRHHAGLESLFLELTGDRPPEGVAPSPRNPE